MVRCGLISMKVVLGFQIFKILVVKRHSKGPGSAPTGSVWALRFSVGLIAKQEGLTDSYRE